MPASLSVEPNLVPKLRIVLADFPYLHSETGRQEAAEPRRPDAVPRYVHGVLRATCPPRDFHGPWCAAARRQGGVDVEHAVAPKDPAYTRLRTLAGPEATSTE